MSQPITRLFAVLLTTCVLQVAATPANAQFGGSRIKRPIDRPTISPYMNLFRRGNNRSPILNYYGSVRPLQQQYQQRQQFSQQIGRLERHDRQNRASNRSSENKGKPKSHRRLLGVTGHVATFGGVGGAGGGSSSGESQFGGGSSGDDGEEQGYSGHSASFSSGRGFGRQE